MQLLSLVLQQFAALETQRDKLRAQVTRLCGENNWLRQELQKHQQQLSHAETELARVVEEKQHLEYLLALPKVCLLSPCTFLAYLIGKDYRIQQGSQSTEDETNVPFNDVVDERHNEEPGRRTPSVSDAVHCHSVLEWCLVQKAVRVTWVVRWRRSRPRKRPLRTRHSSRSCMNTPNSTCSR